MDNPTTKLDWTRMLGFEQIADGRGATGQAQRAPLEAKVGGKPTPTIDARIGAKVGSKPVDIGTKIGAKIGTKPGPV
ncbi:MAG: hypothetical protein ABIS38_05095 [Sphingomicrobium sp.]